MPSKLYNQVSTPHLAFPFRFEGGGSRFGVTEQDSPEEVADAVEVILLTPIGARVDQPDLGIPDPVFRMGGVDEEELEDVIEQWEPRASPEVVSETIERVRVDLKLRSL